MLERKQWFVALAIWSLVAGCSMFRTEVRDGKVCEYVDFGNGATIQVCGTPPQIAQAKKFANERRLSQCANSH